MATCPTKDVPQPAAGAQDARAENDAPLLSVIVPVYNEASSIDALLQRVLAAPYTKQVIVVDDGSTDGTVAALQRWEGHPCVKLLTHGRNRGKGAAIRTALEAARGRLTIIRTPILNMTHRITDEATCYKAFPTDVLRKMDLVCQRFEFCPEVTAKALRMGLHITEVPISYDARSFQAGKKIRWTDGLAAIATLWKWRNWRPVGQVGKGAEDRLATCPTMRRVAAGGK
ncbi:MAG: glycosyltransferase family 2 protein [Thermoguttaceae bacterium]